MTQPESSQQLILIADDEPLVAETLSHILNDEGFKTLSASNGAAAVTLARKERPDVVICDVMMPVMTGIEAAERIREFLPDAYIILFSGHADIEKVMANARSQGHTFEVLSKPVPPELLLTKIASRGL